MEVVVTCDVRSRGHVSRVTRPSTCRVTCCGPGGRGGGARRPKHAASVLRKETKNIILVITSISAEGDSRSPSIQHQQNIYKNVMKSISVHDFFRNLCEILNTTEQNVMKIKIKG